MDLCVTKVSNGRRTIRTPRRNVVVDVNYETGVIKLSVGGVHGTLTNLNPGTGIVQEIGSGILTFKGIIRRFGRDAKPKAAWTIRIAHQCRHADRQRGRSTLPANYWLEIVIPTDPEISPTCMLDEVIDEERIDDYFSRRFWYPDAGYDYRLTLKLLMVLGGISIVAYLLANRFGWLTSL